MQEIVSQRIYPSRLGTFSGLSDPVCRDRDERAEGRKMEFYAREVERTENSRRASLEPSIVLVPTTEGKKAEDQLCARDAKRARGVPEQVLSGEIPIPSADETLTTSEIPAAPFGESVKFDVNSDLSGSLNKQGVKRMYSESTALPNSPGVSSGSGVKRAHGERIVNDDEEQPGIRARISNLIAGPHGNFRW